MKASARFIALFAASFGFAASAAAQTTHTLALAKVTPQTPDAPSGTVTPSVAISGNTFTATVDRSEPRGSGTATITVQLVNDIFTDLSGFGGGVRLTPSPTFKVNAKASGTGISSAASFTITSTGPQDPCTDNFSAAKDYTCSLALLVNDRGSGHQQGYFTLQVTMGFGSVKFLAYYDVDFHDVIPTERLSVVAALPKSGTHLEPGTAPPIFAAVEYELGFKPEAEVYLELRLLDGTFFAASESRRVKRGKGVVGTGGPDDPFLTFFAPDIPEGAGAMVLWAVMSELGGGAKIREEQAATYNIDQPSKLTLEAGRMQDGVFTPLEPDELYILAGQEFNDRFRTLSFRATSSKYDFTPSNAHLTRFFRSRAGALVYYQTKPSPIVNGRQAIFDWGQLYATHDVSADVFQLRFETDEGQLIFSNLVDIPVEGALVETMISPPPLPDGSNATVVRGSSIPINIVVHLHVVRPGQKLLRCISGGDCVAITDVGVGSFNYTDTGVVQAPVNNKDLFGWDYAIAPAEDSPFEDRAVAGAALFPLVDASVTMIAGSGDAVPFSKGKLDPVQTTATRTIKPAHENADVAFLADAARAFGIKELAGRPTPTGGKRPKGADAVEGSQVIAINSAWRFDPPIPADGSFHAGIELRFGPDDLPDDPNFDVSKLEILAVNPDTGQLDRIPSQLDLDGWRVTATIDSLAPAYGLGVVVPRSLPTLSFPAMETASGLQSIAIVVNAGDQAASIRLSAYGAPGVSLSGQGDFPPGSLYAGLASDLFPVRDGQTVNWVQASPSANSFAGLQILTDGRSLEALPLQREPANYAVLPLVERGNAIETEISVANTSNFATQLSLYLYDAAGTQVDSRWLQLPPKGSYRSALGGFFSDIPAAFTGYVVVAAANPVSTVALRQYRASIAASPAQPMPSSAGGPVRLYSAVAAAGARLALVNTTAVSAAITIRAAQDSGAAIGSAVSVTLDPHQQYMTTLDNAGWITVDSSIAGVFGEIQFGDSSPLAKSRMALPLETRPSANFVIPLIIQNTQLATTLVVANPGPAANVRVSVVDVSGATVASRTTSLAAGARSSRLVSAWVPDAAKLESGYVRVDSTQPVLAYAVLAPAGGADAAAIGGVPLPSGAPVGPPVPQGGIEVSPTALDFGSVNSGQTKDLTLVVRNTSGSAISVTSLNSSNARFAVTAPGSSFNVGAGSFQNVTVRFSPSVAGAQTGTLTIASNDPLNPTVTISLSGTGVGAASAPAISLSPATLDFGTVNSGSTKDVTLTVRNNGNATLTVTGISSSNSRFAATGISTPFNVGPGSFQTLSVRFSPNAAGTVTGTLTVASNDPVNASVSASLTGIGGAAPAPAVDVSPASLDFGTVASGQTKDLVLTVRNNGTATLTVSSMSSSNARFAAVQLSTPFNVGAGSFQFVSVRFSPTATTAQSGTLTLATNDPAKPSVVVSLAGNSSGGSGTGGGSTAACLTAPANLVSWWSGDGNANDLTGGNNGTAVGSPAYATGQVAQAFNFNGTSSYVAAGNPANLRLTTGMTIHAWINPRAVRTQTAGPAMGAIVTKWAQNFQDTTDSDSYGLWLIQNGSTVNLFSAIHQAGPKEPTVQGGSIPLNAWSHVAVTFDAASGQYILYVNGQAVASANSPGAILATNHNVFIGREDSFIGRNFDGLIDEPGVFNRALTASEIQAMFNAGANGLCKSGSSGAGSGSGGGTVATGSSLDTSNPLAANLVGLFTMKEGSGTTTKNLADGQTATLAGGSAPTWNTTDPSIVFRGGAALNTYLNAGTDSAFDRMPTSQITIVTRVFLTAVTAAGICEKNDGNNADGFAFGITAPGSVQWTVEKSSNIRVETVAAVTAGRWIQIAVTWDGTRGGAADAHIYVNGVEQQYVRQNNGSGTLGFAAATNQPFRIGTASFDFAGSLNGKMAYLAVYKGRILTPAELTRLDTSLPVK